MWRYLSNVRICMEGPVCGAGVASPSFRAAPRAQTLQHGWEGLWAAPRPGCAPGAPSTAHREGAAVQGPGSSVGRALWGPRLVLWMLKGLTCTVLIMITIAEVFAVFSWLSGHQEAGRAPDFPRGATRGFGPSESQGALKGSAHEWLCWLQDQNHNTGMKNGCVTNFFLKVKLQMKCTEWNSR